LDSIADHFGALADLRDAGLIRHLGISNVRAEHLAQARAIAPVAAVQNRYGVDFGRTNDESVRLCGDHGIAFVPFFALAGTGRETGGGGPTEGGAPTAPAPGAPPARAPPAGTPAGAPPGPPIPGTATPDPRAETVPAGAVRRPAEDPPRLD